MQSPNTIFMVEPIAFRFNPQTAIDNHFQVKDESPDIQSKALNEFKSFVAKLKSKGINVIVAKDTLQPHTPDSIFPNNWVSFHEDGTVCLYPMFAENRRTERRNDIFDQLLADGFKISTIKDYTHFEQENRFLEGTGSMVLDHVHKIAYGAISMRLNEELFVKWCAEFGYEPIAFHANQNVNEQRLSIYHTNTVMCVGSDFAIVSLDTIDNEAERKLVVETLNRSHKEIIDITEEQVEKYAGNMLEVVGVGGQRFLAMSETAFKCLTPKQIQTIQKHAEIIHSDLHTIQSAGGGSARCMMAEMFLPKSSLCTDEK